MQRLAGIIGMVATVMHLTFGCCGAHPGHFHVGHHSCSPSVKTTSTKCCDHDHLHSFVEEVEEADTIDHVLGCQHQSRTCDRCICATTLNAQVVAKWICPDFVTYLVQHDDSLTLTRAVFLDRFEPDPFAYTGLRPHSLFERFSN